jgi:hypothetical protein
MPARWLRVPIVVFWLAMTGWLFWHDLWPNWRPGEPPPFHIDPVEEVQQGPPKTFWTVWRPSPKKEKVFHAVTWVEYHGDDDSYTLHARLDATKDPALTPVYAANILKIETLTSTYRVSREGYLRGLETTVKATPHFNEKGGEVVAKTLRLLLQLSSSPPQAKKERAGSSPQSVELRLWGEVRDEQFFAHCSLSSAALAKPLDLDLPPTAVAHTGSVLLPLHPVNHIRGLRPGQRWRQPLVDPLRDSLAALPGISAGARFLQAHVLPQPETLTVGKDTMTCLVIEYTDGEGKTTARTLVEQDSERVQQQEANLEDGQWILTRDHTFGGGRR